MDKIAIQKKIDKNRYLINDLLRSNETPMFKEILITQLSKSNERFIKQLNE